MPEAQYKYMELDQGDSVVPLKIRRGHCCAVSLTNYFTTPTNVTSSAAVI